MKNDEKTIQVHGDDVEAAIASGLNRLGLRRDQVTIEIIDKGSKGFLGLGGREAIVKLTPIPRPEPPSPPPVEMRAPAGKPIVEPAPHIDETASIKMPAATQKPVIDQEPAEPVGDVKPAAPVVSEAMVEQEQVAVRIVQELLDHMHITASIDVGTTQADDLTGRRMMVLNISGGEEVNALVGARGEILNDMQYLARLMAGNALHGRADFILDVNQYRRKREQALASLARRMGQKAIQRGKPVTLEPMSPYDRRIIHMTLREDSRVYTQSTGEGNHRRVRIFPKDYADD